MEQVVGSSRRWGEEGVNLALLTDGLRAEREQKITIDVVVVAVNKMDLVDFAEPSAVAFGNRCGIPGLRRNGGVGPTPSSTRPGRRRPTWTGWRSRPRGPSSTTPTG